MSDISKYVGVFYVCQNCAPNMPDMEFCVHTKSDPETHKQICSWCGHLAQKTGKVEKVEDGFLVTYKDKVEVKRWKLREKGKEKNEISN